MALHFITDDARDAQAGSIVRLRGAEAKHAATVRRVRVGESITLGDGAGVWLEGEARAVSPGEVEIEVSERVVTEPPTPRLMLVQALAKGDRDELAVQAACELGVDVVVPWQATRSVSRWEGAKAHKGQARWATIVREAAKQAHRAWVPDVDEVVTTNQLAGRAGGVRTLVLDPVASTKLSDLETDGRDIALVVGPEGGIDEAEFEKLTAAGAERVRLGKTVLRTSTAGPAAIAILSVALGRW